jgi:hypothetical protein
MTTPLQQRNQTLFQRTVALTEAALAKLQADRQTVTLAAVATTTREIDPEGRGLSTTTIVRNPEALAAFRHHSPAYQQKLKQTTLCARNKSSPTEADPYPTLNRPDLIQMIETLQAENDRLKARLSALQVERDTAYRLRDEALNQNTRQLAVLARLMDPTKTSDETHEPSR